MKQRALDLESKRLGANLRAPTYKDCHFLRPCNGIPIFYPSAGPEDGYFTDEKTGSARLSDLPQIT